MQTVHEEDDFSTMKIAEQRVGGKKKYRNGHKHRNDTQIITTGKQQDRKYFVVDFHDGYSFEAYDNNFDIKTDSCYYYGFDEKGENYGKHTGVIQAHVFPIIDNKVPIPKDHQRPYGGLWEYGLIIDPYDCDFEKYDCYESREYRYRGKPLGDKTKDTKEDGVIQKTSNYVTNEHRQLCDQWKKYWITSQDKEHKEKLIKFALEQNDRRKIRSDNMHKSGDKTTNKVDRINELRLRRVEGQTSVKTKAIIVKTFNNIHEYFATDIFDEERCKFIINFCRVKNKPYVYLFNNDSQDITKVDLVNFIKMAIDVNNELHGEYPAYGNDEQAEKIKSLQAIAAKVQKGVALSLKEENKLNTLGVVRHKIEKAIEHRLGTQKKLYWDRDGKDKKLMNERFFLKKNAEYIRRINNYYDTLCEEGRDRYDVDKLNDLLTLAQADHKHQMPARY